MLTEMATKKYVNEGEQPSTAGVLRLVEPWFNTSRTIYGDSAFASVNTAVKLRQHGLHFSGLVKTAHREFPLKYFRSLPLQTRSGDSIYLTSTRNEFPLIVCSNCICLVGQNTKTIHFNCRYQCGSPTAL